MKTKVNIVVDTITFHEKIKIKYIVYQIIIIHNVVLSKY